MDQVLAFPLLLQTTPCSFLHFKKGPKYDKPQTNGPDYWTARPNYGLPDASSDCFETRKRMQHSHYFAPYHIPQTASPVYVMPLDSARGGHSSWGSGLLCSPPGPLGIKAIFLLSPSSVSVLIYSASVGRESQDFGGNMGTNLLKSEGVGMAVRNKAEMVKSQNKCWGRWRTQGGKPGHALSWKASTQFLQGRSLRRQWKGSKKKVTSIGASFSSSFQRGEEWRRRVVQRPRDEFAKILCFLLALLLSVLILSY